MDCMRVRPPFSGFCKLDIVDNDPVVRLREHHAAPMRDAVVSVVAGVDKVALAVSSPLADVDVRAPSPPEGALRLDLVAAVDHHRTVRCRAAEEVAPFRF